MEEKEREIEDVELFGQKVKEGTLTVQINEDWVRCYVIVRDGGNIQIKYPDESTSEHNITPEHIEIEIMPDNARRSRESKLFPFAVRQRRQKKERKKSRSGFGSVEIHKISNLHESGDIKEGVAGYTETDNSRIEEPLVLPFRKGSTDLGRDIDDEDEYHDHRERQEIILATTDGRSMWEWASAIQFLGCKPKEEEIPLFREAVTIADHEMYYESPVALQTTLLKLFTYKNLPSKPITFEELALIDVLEQRRKEREDRRKPSPIPFRYITTCLRYIAYPEGFLPRDLLSYDDDDDIESDTSNVDVTDDDDSNDNILENDVQDDDSLGNIVSSIDNAIDNVAPSIDNVSVCTIPSVVDDDDEDFVKIESVQNLDDNVNIVSPSRSMEKASSTTSGIACNLKKVDDTTSMGEGVDRTGIVTPCTMTGLTKIQSSMTQGTKDDAENGDSYKIDEYGAAKKEHGEESLVISKHQPFSSANRTETNDEYDEEDVNTNIQANHFPRDDEDHLLAAAHAAYAASPLGYTDLEMMIDDDQNCTSSVSSSVCIETATNLVTSVLKDASGKDLTKTPKSDTVSTSELEDEKGGDLPSDLEGKGEEDSQPKTKKDILIENHEHLFGLFAYLVLVGSCVQVNEKCFELITSTNLYDLSSQANWKGNSPFSMLCEGDYNTSRNYIVKALWDMGYPKLDGFHANYSCDTAFSVFVSKPANLYGISNVTGQPVHLEDQKLCRLLRKHGDGRKENIMLSEDLLDASNKEETEFESEHRRKITTIIFPAGESFKNWGCNTLLKLDLSCNGIFEIPDELYDFVNLTHLDISRNCIFGLSHKLGKLTNLENLRVSWNLITELPDTIENLDQITAFDCSENPITKPPSAVWSRGIADVRNYFRDMRESGIEKNVDLRVLVLGLSEAGKTSLINGLIQPGGMALTRVGDRTVGIEQRTWVMARRDNDAANLLVYDFAGQEEYYITHHLFLGSKALYILAFDLSKYNDESLDKQILLWWDSIQNRVCDVKSNDSKTPKVIIVGTHADMVSEGKRIRGDTGAQALANRILKKLQEHLKLRMNCIKDRIKLIEKELNTLDPRTRRKKGEKIIDDHDSDEDFTLEEQKEYEKLPLDVKIQIQTLECEVDKLRHQKDCAIALPSTIHAVSSKTFENYDKLMDQISSSLTEIGPSGKYFPQLDEHLPASWFRVRKFVREQSTRRGRECMKLPHYFKLVLDELGIQEDVCLRATRFCHELGDVLFFEKEGLVFLRPSLLIDVFKLVIRHDHKESTYWKKDMLKDFGIDEEKFNIGKDLLLRKGELEEWLLNVLWSPLLDDGELGVSSSESNIRNNLIQLLETFDIATPVEYNGGHKKLLIPEFQPKTIQNGHSWHESKMKGDFEIQRWICVVDRKLPHGLLKRVQVRILKKMFKRGRSNNEFSLAQNEFLITDSRSSTAIYCKSGVRSSSEEYLGSDVEDWEGISLYVRGSAKRSVISLLKKVYNCLKDTLRDFPGLIFDHYAVYTFPKNIDSLSSSAFIKLEELKARQDAGERKMYIENPVAAIGENDTAIKGKEVKIDDLLPSSSSFHSSKVRR